MRRIALLGLVLLQACVSPGVHPLRPHDLAMAQYQGIVSDTFTGSLFYQGGCLLFRDDRRTVQLLPVWPAGSVFNGTSVIFVEPGRADQPIVMGEEVLLEGRQLDWQVMSHPAFAQFHRQCGSLPFVIAHVRPAN